jgi:hypothetical protein
MQQDQDQDSLMIFSLISNFMSIALVCVSTIKLVIILTLFIVFYQRSNINMVVDSSNSLVISAACRVVVPISSRQSSPESEQLQQHYPGADRPDEPDQDYEYKSRNFSAQNRLKNSKRHLPDCEDTTNDDIKMRKRLVATSTPQYIHMEKLSFP